MHEREILFTFNAKEHKAGLDMVLATLQEDTYSAHARLVFSEDETQAKIVLQGDIAQINNLDGFLRSVAGVKTLSDHPHAELVTLIKCYHHNLWDELNCPHEEMHLSAFVSGLAMRQALLDCPDWREVPDLWKQGEVCYQAMEESDLFESLADFREMILYSFVSGYMAERGTCELAMDAGRLRETAKIKAEALRTEEQGRPDIIIHAFALQVREMLLSSGCRNAMQLLKRVRGQQ
jgi:hypothetical protein